MTGRFLASSTVYGSLLWLLEPLTRLVHHLQPSSVSLSETTVSLCLVTAKVSYLRFSPRMHSVCSKYSTHARFRPVSKPTKLEALPLNVLLL